jgi:hypothetical protein
MKQNILEISSKPRKHTSSWRGYKQPSQSLVFRLSVFIMKQESEEIKTVTHRERRLFPIDGFVDVSQVPSRIDRGGVKLSHISKSITPGDAYIQDAFLQFKNKKLQRQSP